MGRHSTLNPHLYPIKMKQLLLFCAFFLFQTLAAQQYADAVSPDWRAAVPRPVCEDAGLVELYEKAWETAATRVRRGPEGLPATPYLDENCYDDQIWIWDTCFMTLYCRYAAGGAFPANQTLFNLYAPLHDGATTPLLIHMRDNPPIFAWVEAENYAYSADSAQADLVVKDKRYLQRHYEYFNTVPRGDVNTRVAPAYNPIFRDVFRDAQGRPIGYSWTGRGSGMDNTVRGVKVADRLAAKAKGRELKAEPGDSVLWIDAVSQQALSALYISRLCRARGMDEEGRTWLAEYERLKQEINTRYWDEADGFYYDVDVRDGSFCKVKTPASFWAMLAEVPDAARAERMVRYLRSADHLGGDYPWTSLSRDDPDHNSTTGDYWRGGIWLPVVYMGTKALEKYGYTELADSLAERVVRQQLRTYRHFSPATIWECYSPSADRPSTEHGSIVRPDFCGWSALGPISLFIENILGFRRAEAATRTLTWDLKRSNGTHGLRNLSFGDVKTDIVYDAEKKKITVTSNCPYRLEIPGRRTLCIKAGTHTYKASRLAR